MSFAHHIEAGVFIGVENDETTLSLTYEELGGARPVYVVLRDVVALVYDCWLLLGI